jgi:hypothetical protein
MSPCIRASNFNTALAACEHKAITGVRRDVVCTLYQGVRLLSKWTSLRQYSRNSRRPIELRAYYSIKLHPNRTMNVERITIHYAPT